jgi:hypothetical protein
MRGLWLGHLHWDGFLIAIGLTTAIVCVTAWEMYP